MPSIRQTRRHWFGYCLIAATVVISIALWLLAMWRGEGLHENPWIYPAKVGSHGTLILMCWAFILSTRFRVVEVLFGGLDKVYQAHRKVGETAFFLIFLHPVFLAVAHSDSVGGFFRYLWFSGDWVRNTGLIVLAAFTLLVVLSIYWKIAYHRWKRTHDFFGLLMVLVVVHAVISKGEIVTYPMLALWHGVWVAVGLACYVYIRVLYRFIGPQFDYVTKEVKEAGDKVTEIWLEPKGRPMAVGPGQFVYISFDADAVSEEPHPFSVSSPPESPLLRLSIKRLGDWTSDVGNIRAGERARLWGPYGHFSEVLWERPDLPAVLIGGGIGITPFVSIVGSKAMEERTGETTLVYSAPDRESLVYDRELAETAARLPRLRYLPHLSDEEGFIDRGYLDKLLRRPLGEHLFFVCGPGPMMDALRDLFDKAGVKPTHVVMEEFSIRD